MHIAKGAAGTVSVALEHDGAVALENEGVRKLGAKGLDETGLAVEVERVAARARAAMVRPAGFEPATPGLGILCSILLSYGRNALKSLRFRPRLGPAETVLNTV